MLQGAVCSILVTVADLSASRVGGAEVVQGLESIPTNQVTAVVMDPVGVIHPEVLAARVRGDLVDSHRRSHRPDHSTFVAVFICELVYCDQPCVHCCLPVVVGLRAHMYKVGSSWFVVKGCDKNTLVFFPIVQPRATR